MASVSKDTKFRISASGFSVKDWLTAGVLAVASAILYFASMATYLYPGESASLRVLWSGLDTVEVIKYPLAKFFAGFFGYGNVFAPVCGIIAVVALFLLVTFLVRLHMANENSIERAPLASRIAGVVAAVVFMLTPAVREAATHLEPRIFDVAWLLLSLLLLVPYLRAPKAIAWIYPVAIAVMVSFGVMDGPLFLVSGPLLFIGLWKVSRLRGGRGYSAGLGFLSLSAILFFCIAPSMYGSFVLGLKFLAAGFMNYTAPRYWMLVFFFATFPFIISLFSMRRAFSEKSTWMQWSYHVAMTFISILAIATTLSPSDLMRPYGILPVAASTCAAFTAGYLVIYWILQVRLSRLASADKIAHLGGGVGLVAGGIYSLVLLITLCLNFFMFSRDSGAFADEIAKRVIADLGDRTWFITDGTLDDHLRFIAKKENRELNLVCLNRDLNKAYLRELGDLVREKKLCEERDDDLSIALSLGVLTFVQDWFTIDKDVAKKVAIFGAPDMWYVARITPIPELYFFGADPDRKADWSQWKEIDKILEAPKGWGSYKLWKVESPVERMRLNLRRHMGFIANNRGVYLQDQKKDDEAFAMYELVMNEIDADNVCTLFNEFEFARRGYKKALDKVKTIESKLNAIKKDESRRYRLWALGNYYGYIRSPEIFMKLGFNWARSGRPGEALQQIHRAIDFVPVEKRGAFANMMASLYASGNDVVKSREIYESVLARDAKNHDALMGLMRLELLDGNTEKAMKYLEMVTAEAGDSPALRMEVALLYMMRGDLDKATETLQKVTDAQHDNLQAWSLLGAVTLQRIDAAKDDATRDKHMKYLEDVILKTMEKQAKTHTDYYLQTTRGFMMLRKKEDRRREARDAFASAVRERPDIASTADIVLDLDIQLNDTEHAEKQAREILRRNRFAPLANYVMGSIALSKDRMAEAETFLRRATDCSAPVPLAFNDLAELLRRTKRFDEAERYARLAIKATPNLYVTWETLASTLLGYSNADKEAEKVRLAEAERCMLRACELSKDKEGKYMDLRMLITLARVQFLRGEDAKAKANMRIVKSRISELSEAERKEFEEIQKRVR